MVAARRSVLVDDWTPDTLQERNERIGWAMRNNQDWRLLNGGLVVGEPSSERVQDLLTEAMYAARAEWQPRLRQLAADGVPVAAQGTYGASGAYPLAAALAAVTASTTSETQLLTAAQGAVFLPLPANGMLAPRPRWTGRVA